MSEQLMVCKALAAMIRKHGDPSEEEVNFVGHAAYELALTPEQNQVVQKVLKNGGDYASFIKEITSKHLKAFLFRRIVAATLIDQKIEDQEMAVINETASIFDYKRDTVLKYLAWMQEGVAWEKRGAELLAQL